MKVLSHRGALHESRLPLVGEIWKHRSDEEVYMRISDSQGRRAHGHNDDTRNCFYSVGLTLGNICNTMTSAPDTIVLGTKCLII